MCDKTIDIMQSKIKGLSSNGIDDKTGILIDSIPIILSELLELLNISMQRYLVAPNASRLRAIPLTIWFALNVMTVIECNSAINIPAAAPQAIPIKMLLV